MMNVTCIVAAAGKGKRLRRRKEKPFLLLGRKPLIIHTLEALNAIKYIDRIIVVVAHDKVDDCKRLVTKYRLNKVYDIVKGGKRRFDSVKNGLAKVKEADYILIHDGARPFIRTSLVKKIIFATRRFKAAIPATPSKQTLKLVDKGLFVKRTPERSFLWEAQTPQGFKRHVITEAYKKVSGRNVTDDSNIIEHIGYRVKIVKGSPWNIKITTPEDLLLAEGIIKHGLKFIS